HGEFTIVQVFERVTQKLSLRHPHVFEDSKLHSAQDVLDNWDKLKADERAASGKKQKTADSILDDVPVHFPGLLEALKVTKKAAKVGFDWRNADEVFAKIEEEIGELRQAQAEGDLDHVAD